jgi:D-sedoheptulose 7-phosphate isomerase
MNQHTQDHIMACINAHKELLDAYEKDYVNTIARAATLIIRAIQQGQRVYVCGNGGSAADAQHIAGELVWRFECERRALPVLALTTDTSLMTAIANDNDSDEIFARQVEALVCQHDVLWALSTSGVSSNIIKAAKLAKSKGASILSFTGKENSALEKLSDLCLCARSESTARSQEIHQLAYHIICALVEKAFCETQEPIEGK